MLVKFLGVVVYFSLAVGYNMVVSHFYYRMTELQFENLTKIGLKETLLATRQVFSNPKMAAKQGTEALGNRRSLKAKEQVLGNVLPLVSKTWPLPSLIIASSSVAGNCSPQVDC
jgi:hypothetical protein